MEDLAVLQCSHWAAVRARTGQLFWPGISSSSWLARRAGRLADGRTFNARRPAPPAAGVRLAK